MILFLLKVVILPVLVGVCLMCMAFGYMDKEGFVEGAEDE